MIQYLKSMFTPSKAKTKQELPRVPKGHRVYAVGDVHGRSDLFTALVDAIEEDIRDGEAEGLEPDIVLLGDLVDRGPDSAGVIELARKWTRTRTVHVLCGNHEEMFLNSFEDKDILRHFLRHGGRETLLSYGMDRKIFTKATLDEIQQMLEEFVPKKHRKFISGFEDMVQLGDYLFVHAGIEPGVPLDEQKQRSLRWIREPFLSYGKSHGLVVVHGHTITDEVVDAGNRIGIDTGAYASGRLTALVLEGKKRRYLTAIEGKNGAISVDGAKLKV
ncbi:serine/threonine protein phosphatase [Aurantiacibacter marinus]|uniref:Serine/threonine protein phosphatase n=2 Tax=Aurantiacibacter marinus TaxID=874156 RepID=A0A0H0XQW3_9SPHN|nr:serine/threonine protein phosphatase [Aurantiacibacter marinus]